jgi:hypothetical protein
MAQRHARQEAASTIGKLRLARMPLEQRSGSKPLEPSAKADFSEGDR